MNIRIRAHNYRCYHATHPATLLLAPGFAALVGENNSGKSALLRLFYDFRNHFKALCTRSRWCVSTATNSYTTSFPDTGSPPSDLFTNTSTDDLFVTIELVPEISVDEPLDELEVSRLVLVIHRRTYSHSVQAFRGSAFTAVPPKRDASTVTVPETLTDGRPVDARRMLNALNMLTRMRYFGPNRHLLGAGSNPKHFDIEIGRSFVNLVRVQRAGIERAQRDRTMAAMRDVARLMDAQGLDIQASLDDSDLIVSFNGMTYRAYELGNGLVQVLLSILTASIERPSYLLIDEPETGLHPALQVAFVRTLAKYADAGLILATHSFGLARTVAPKSMYAVARHSGGHSLITPYDAVRDLAPFVSALSYAGFFQGACRHLLLVEGSTDPAVYSAFLALYSLDTQVLCLDLGGYSTISGAARPKLQSLLEIIPSISVIIDRDRPDGTSPLDPPRAAFVAVCRDLGIHCHVLTKRATENYFPLQAIQTAKADCTAALTPYEKLADHRQGWNKGLNGRIASSMTRADLDDTDLATEFRRLLRYISERAEGTTRP